MAITNDLAVVVGQSSQMASRFTSSYIKKRIAILQRGKITSIKIGEYRMQRREERRLQQYFPVPFGCLFHAHECRRWIRQTTFGSGGDFDGQAKLADAIRECLQMFCRQRGQARRFRLQ